MGWVYRAEEELAPVDIEETVAEVAAEVRHVPAAELAAEAVSATGKPAQDELPPLPPVAHQPPPSFTGMAVMSGMGVFAIGMITTGLVTLAAFTMLTAPVRMARRWMGGK